MENPERLREEQPGRSSLARLTAAIAEEFRVQEIRRREAKTRPPPANVFPPEPPWWRGAAR